MDDMSELLVEARPIIMSEIRGFRPACWDDEQDMISDCNMRLIEKIGMCRSGDRGGYIRAIVRSALLDGNRRRLRRERHVELVGLHDV